MREVIIILIIIIIIVLSAYYTQNFLNNSSDLLVSKLEDLKSYIEENDIVEYREELSIKTDEIYENWEEINEKWSILVLHDEIDLIETSLIRMKSKIKVGSIEESVEDLDTSIFLLKHIKEKEKTSLKNIF